MTSQDLWQSQSKAWKSVWIWPKKKKKVGGWRISLYESEEIQELINTTREELTDDNLMEMSASQPVPDNEEKGIEEVLPENKLRWDNLTEVFWLFKTAFDFFMAWDLL